MSYIQPMATASKGGARARLMKAADKLFYERGINTVGVNEIVEVAEVAKTSLYLHFPSKDDLVAAYLAARVAKYTAEWREILDETGDDSPERMLDAIFDEVADYVAMKNFNGCPFWKAAAEIGNPKHPAWGSLLEYRRYLRDEVFGAIAGRSDAGDPDALAEQFLLLYEAALAGAFVDRTGSAVERARDASHCVMRNAAPAGGAS